MVTRHAVVARGNAAVRTYSRTIVKIVPAGTKRRRVLRVGAKPVREQRGYIRRDGPLSVPKRSLNGWYAFTFLRPVAAVRVYGTGRNESPKDAVRQSDALFRERRRPDI